MYFNIFHRALVFASLLSLFLAVCATPTTPSRRSSDDIGTRAVKQLKQFDIRKAATKTYPNRRGAPSGIPAPDPDTGSGSDDGDDNSWDGNSWDKHSWDGNSWDGN
jgi:hypothetical protein